MVTPLPIRALVDHRHRTDPRSIPDGHIVLDLCHGLIVKENIREAIFKFTHSEVSMILK